MRRPKIRIKGIDFEKCLMCKKRFVIGKGYDRRNYFCSEDCYEKAKLEGWIG